jgi:hypothetical protein
MEIMPQEANAIIDLLDIIHRPIFFILNNVLDWILSLDLAPTE